MKYSKPTENNGRLKSVEIYEGESIETDFAIVTGKQIGRAHV